MTFILRYRLSKLLRKLYKSDSFWKVWRIPVPENKEETAKYASKLLRDPLADIVDKRPLIKFLEARAMVYLKEMDFRHESDTATNRAKLLECLQLKALVERAIAEEVAKKVTKKNHVADKR